MMHMMDRSHMNQTAVEADAGGGTSEEQAGPERREREHAQSLQQRHLQQHDRTHIATSMSFSSMIETILCGS